MFGKSKIKKFVVYNSGLYYNPALWVNDVKRAELFDTYDEAQAIADVVGGSVQVEYV
jgi:hypothetical protein